MIILYKKFEKQFNRAYAEVIEVEYDKPRNQEAEEQGVRV